MLNKTIIAVVLFLGVVVAVSGCGKDNLNGTWQAVSVNNELQHQFPDVKIDPDTITFSGKSFTLITTAAAFGPLNDHPDVKILATKRLPNVVQDLVLAKTTLKGTFSLSADKSKMETIVTNQSPRISSFSRTDNTITIDNQRFNRK